MDTYTVLLVSVLLLLASVGLLFSHVNSWQAAQRQSLDADEYDYRRRQFRRRMQTSAMLGLLAIAMPVGYVLTVWLRLDLFVFLFWTAMMALACWIALLALTDIWATKHHFGRLRHACLVEQAKLQAEIRRIQAVGGNGKPEARDEGETGHRESEGKQ
jgi:hypothetical protein